MCSAFPGQLSFQVSDNGMADFLLHGQNIAHLAFISSYALGQPTDGIYQPHIHSQTPARMPDASLQQKIYSKMSCDISYIAFEILELAD